MELPEEFASFLTLDFRAVQFKLRFQAYDDPVPHPLLLFPLYIHPPTIRSSVL